MESFEENKATEEERIRSLEGNVMAILEHISQVDYEVVSIMQLNILLVARVVITLGMDSNIFTCISGTVSVSNAIQ